jgi:iron complex transport system ATP-binding protein
MVQEPDIMLLDEPTNHLDLRHQVEIMGMIHKRTQTNSHSAFAALHDVNLAARYCSHVVMLFGEGTWCAGPTGEMLSESSLERLYHCTIERLEGVSGPRFHPAASACISDQASRRQNPK